jgi:hypothetical protein
MVGEPSEKRIADNTISPGFVVEMRQNPVTYGADGETY